MSILIYFTSGENKTPFHDRISPDQKIRQNCGSKTVIPTGWQSRLWGDLCNGLTTMEINVLIKTHSKINYSWPVSEGPLFIQGFFKRLSGLSWGGHRGIPAYDWVDLIIYNEMHSMVSHTYILHGQVMYTTGFVIYVFSGWISGGSVTAN